MATTYTLKYSANGGNEGTVPTTQTFSSDAKSYSFVIGNQRPTRQNYTFFCWSKNKNTTFDSPENEKYFATQSIIVLSNSPTITLYAVWVENHKSIGTSNVVNISQDIHLEDKANWMQFTKNWKEDKFSAVILSLGSSQFETKKMISYVLNIMCNKLVVLQGHKGEKAETIPLSSGQPENQSDNEMWFKVVENIESTNKDNNENPMGKDDGEQSINKDNTGQPTSKDDGEPQAKSTKTFGDVDEKQILFENIDELNLTFGTIDKGEW